jgi:hypothetical protein
MDQSLRAIARAAEQDETYGLWLLTSDGSLFGGATRPSEFFLEESAEGMIRGVALERAGGRQRHVDRHLDAAREFVSEQLAPIHAHVTDDGEALTLAPAQWTPQHGQYTLRFPVVRVAIANVAAWWLVGGEVTDEVKQGGSWFIGGVFGG